MPPMHPTKSVTRVVVLEAYTEGGIKAAVNSIVTNRNKIAHGEDVSLGLAGLKDYYKSAKKLVERLEQMCDPSVRP